MNLQQLRLSEQSLGKLSQLAMAVELHEHKRFSLRKDIDQVVGLLKVASNSANQGIQDRLGELSATLTQDTLGFFRTLGVGLETLRTSSTAKGQQTYRGQVVAKPAQIQAPVEPVESAPSTGKKKIIYRGKVIYR